MGERQERGADMIREDLKRCPFCGGRANMWSWNYGVRIDCENWYNNDHLVGIEAPTEEEAIKGWQTRYSEVKHD